MLNPSAIGMLIFGSVVLYGGLIYFLYHALKKKEIKRKKHINKDK